MELLVDRRLVSTAARPDQLIQAFAGQLIDVGRSSAR